MPRSSSGPGSQRLLDRERRCRIRGPGAPVGGNALAATRSWRPLRPSRRRRKPSVLEEPRPASLDDRRMVAGARVRTPDVGADGADIAVRVPRVGEVVAVAPAGDRRADRPMSPRPSRCAAHHGGGEPLAPPGIAAGDTVEMLPEGAHVLVQLAQHKIGAIQAEVDGALAGRGRSEAAPRPPDTRSGNRGRARPVRGCSHSRAGGAGRW